MKGILILGVFGLSGMTYAAVGSIDLTVWITCGTAVSATFLWMGRVVSRVSADRQCVLDKIGHQADRVERLAMGMDGNIAEIKQASERTDFKVDGLSERLSTLEGTCAERGRSCETAMKILDSANRLKGGG